MNRLRHHLYAFFIVVIFMTPLLLLLIKPQTLVLTDPSVVFEVLLDSCVQSAWSAALSVILGIFGGLSLLRFKNHTAIQFFESLVMIPALLPPLFIITAVINVSSLFGVLPFGFLVIVIVNTLVNTGYVATRVRRLFGERMGSLLDLARIDGASQKLILKNSLGYLQKDLWLLFFVIFCLCFTSFSLPLVLGGRHGGTLEVLIYTQFRMNDNLGAALGFAYLQMALLFALGGLFSRDFQVTKKTDPQHFLFSFSTVGFGILLVPVAFVLFGLVVQGPSAVLQFINYFHQLPLVAWTFNSLLLGLTVGLGVFIFSVVLVVLMPHAGLRTFFLGYAQPSVAAFGMSLVLMNGSTPMWVWIKLTMGLILILAPIVFRWVLLSPLFSIEDQMVSAHLLGASRLQIFRSVVFPQLAWPLFQGSGLAAAWGASDFSLSTFLAQRESTLPLAIDNLLNSYRQDLATALIWILLLLAGFCYLLFAGIGHGLDRKYNS